jgi:LysR family glycine cleavage system transcriptional activator
MDWLKLPPLNSLRAFSAVAETGSFTLAADKLNVTHAAVSQQVKLLENRVGIPLVVREGRGIALTEDGRRLARSLDGGFSLIERGVERLLFDTAEQPVQVTMSPAFAVEWLLPRLNEFQRAHRDITLLLNPTSELVDPAPGGPDVAIRYRDNRRPIADVPTVLVTDMVIIGAPELVSDRPFNTPDSLVELPWLQELGTNEVADWLRYHGIVPNSPLNITHMPGNLIMNAVRRGDGITYSARAFFQEDIAAGRMIELYSEPMFGFYYVETQSSPNRLAVRTFVDWLLAKADTVHSE